MHRRTLLAAPFLATAALARPAWLARPIRIVTPTPAGSPDAAAEGARRGMAARAAGLRAE